MSQIDVFSGLNPHLKTIIDPQTYVVDAKKQAKGLVSYKRLDVVAKYLYLKLSDNGLNEQAEEIYCSHIKAMNNFFEGDGGGKEGKERFISSFKDTAQSIKENGFDSEVSVLPIDTNGHLIDGGHRLASALHNDLEVSVRQFDYVMSSSFDYSFFNNKLDPLVLEQIVDEYCKIKEACLALMIWPKAAEHIQLILDKVSQISDVVYCRTYEVNELALQNIIIHTYKDEPWLKGISENFSGMHPKYNEVRGDSGLVTYIVVENINSQELQKLKEEIRSELGLGNAALHSFDSPSLVGEINKIFLNENSREALKEISVKQMNDEFKKLFISAQKVFRKNVPYVITSSFIMGLFGIRTPKDIDYLSTELLEVPAEFGSHDSQVDYYSCDKELMVADRRKYFHFLGLKIMTIEELVNFKKKRGEKKDNEDLRLIKMRFLTFVSSSNRKRLLKVYTKSNSYIQRIVNKPIVKRSLAKFERRSQRGIVKVQQGLSLLGYDTSREYLGYKVHHYPGDSLVSRLKKNNYYEPQVNTFLYKQIKDKENPVFVDIGANIGLTSLTIKRWCPKVSIYCFEPGPNQYHYLDRNIKSNKLKAVRSYNVALSDKEALLDFSVHRKFDSSGDGILDTGRVPLRSKIQVQSKTMDSYLDLFLSEGIDLIKIDTEGAEMLVLQGMKSILKQFSPGILFEFWPANAVKYQLTLADFVDFFESVGYCIETMKGEPVGRSNYRDYEGIDDMFWAKRISFD